MQVVVSGSSVKRVHVAYADASNPWPSHSLEDKPSLLAPALLFSLSHLPGLPEEQMLAWQGAVNSILAISLKL